MIKMILSYLLGYNHIIKIKKHLILIYLNGILFLIFVILQMEIYIKSISQNFNKND